MATVEEMQAWCEAARKLLSQGKQRKQKNVASRSDEVAAILRKMEPVAELRKARASGLERYEALTTKVKSLAEQRDRKAVGQKDYNKSIDELQRALTRLKEDLRVEFEAVRDDKVASLSDGLSDQPALVRAVNKTASGRVREQLAAIQTAGTGFEFTDEKLSTGAEFDPKKNVIKIQSGQSPAQQFDNILYESCNATRKTEQTAITDALEKGDLSPLTYGEQYGELEFEATLEYAEIILTMGEKELTDRAKRLKTNWVGECGAEEYFRSDTDPERREELKNELRRAFLESPHSVEEDAGPVASLTTGDMYIYEKIQGMRSVDTHDAIRSILKLAGMDEPEGMDEFFRSLEFNEFVATCPDDPDLKPDAYVRLLELISTRYEGVADVLAASSGFNESMTDVARAPLTEEQALAKLEELGDVKDRLELLMSPAMRTCVGLNVESGDIKALLAYFPSTARIRGGIEEGWPNSGVKTLLLRDLPAEPEEEELDEEAFVDAELVKAVIALKTSKAVTSFIPPDAQGKVLSAVDDVVEALRSTSTGAGLRKAYEDLIAAIDDLPNQGMKKLQLRFVKPTFTNVEDEIEEAAVKLG